MRLTRARECVTLVPMPTGWHDHEPHDLRRGDVVEWLGQVVDEGPFGVLKPGDRGHVTLVEPDGDVVVNFGPEKPGIDVETCPSSVRRVEPQSR